LTPSSLFPPDFTWGVSTSAYQIEGGVDLDGRGPSIWDTFCAGPGHVRGGGDGSVAADHRRRMHADVDLLASLGIKAYRFSVAWPRVQPTGTGAGFGSGSGSGSDSSCGSGSGSSAGLDFYRDLVDALLDASIEPFVTLYHWDLPQPRQDAGGWPARDTAAHFADYAAVVGAALGDRVRHWTTINEPWCAAMLGYGAGIHAPGITDAAAAVRAAHHLLLAHGMAVDALRAVVRPDAEVGITLNPYPVVSARTGTDAGTGPGPGLGTGTGPLKGDDEDAVRRVDGIANRLWYDAVLRGRYPDDVLEDLSAVSDFTHVRDGDLAVISRPIDALGINYYRRHHVRYVEGASASAPHAMWPGSPDIELVDPDAPHTDGGWAIEPDGLTEALIDVTKEYDPPPLYVHECGAAFTDPPRGQRRGADRTVDDPGRLAYLHDHIDAASDAVAAGVDLRGFFVWSLLDNFEWAEGYTNRFGIIHVDFATQQRTPKSSARWYARFIAGTPE
jgi:beta-glucosidase